MEKHRCRTYFSITGNFNPQALIKRLGVEADKAVTKGDKTPYVGKVAEFSYVKIGYNDTYDVDVNVMIRKTIAPLLDKTELLRHLKEKFGLKYAIVVVPEIVAESEDPKPVLSLDWDIIEFMYLTGAEHDLDYYVY